MQPEYSYLFVLAISLFWATTLILSRKTNSHAQNIWIWVMLDLAVCSFIYFLYQIHTMDSGLYYQITLIDMFTGLSYHTLVFYYFLMVLNGSPFNKRNYLWLAPSAFITLAYLVFLLLFSKEEYASYARALWENYEELHTFDTLLQRMHYFICIKGFYLVIGIQAPVMFLYIIWKLLGYRNRLKENFSSLEGKSLKVITRMIICLFLLVSFYSISPFVGGEFETYSWARYLVALTGAVYYLMGYYVYSMEFTAEDLVRELELVDQEAVERKYATLESDQNSDQKTLKYRMRLAEFIRLIDEEEVFRQNDLRMEDLARMMETNRTYISQMIRDEYNCSFSELINRKRIEYAQKLYLTNPQMTQENIAYQSGYLYNTSFSRAFKSNVGMTFREWMKTM